MRAAKTLEEALNTLDVGPLSAEDLAAFYVQRPRLKTAELVTELRLTQEPRKFLFIGHRGGGKSTELNKVVDDLYADFNAIRIPVRAVFQGGELTHEELVFAIYSRVADKAVKEGWIRDGVLPKLKEAFLSGVVDDVQRWLFGPTGSGITVDRALTVKLGGWGLELEQKIALDGNARDNLKGRTGEFLGLIDRFLGEIRSATGRRVLLIVEDLDKFDLASAEALFFTHAQTLLRPQAPIIYTCPMALRSSDSFPTVEQDFRAYFLPNIAIHHRDGRSDAKGRALHRDLIVKRADENLFAPGVLKYFVDHGGLVRNVLRLAQRAVLAAITEGLKQVTKEHAKEAFAEAMRIRQSILRPGDYPLLEQSDGTPVANTPEVRRLLFNGSLLEYQNTTGDWCAPSPDAKALLAGPARPALPQP